MTGPGASSLCYSVTELGFVCQFVPQQPILKAMIHRLKSDTDKVNKHVYESMNENEKMLLKTQKRLDQKSCCKRNLKATGERHPHKLSQIQNQCINTGATQWLWK